jgi:L-malate glycosyltransferase
MRIGIVCYASVGGSGVVATELSHALASRGHEIHLVSSELPFRWRTIPGLTFERVVMPAYPLFHEPQYLLGLTNTLVRVSRERHLDILHAHYAVPHATAAYLAHQILDSSCGTEFRAPRTVTTLHGTDITLVGSDPSYARVVSFSIEQSHGVTAVSRSLRQQTIQSLGISRDIRVIPNFLDCAGYQRQGDRKLSDRMCPRGDNDAVILHVSNFRPVKRVGMVLDVFLKIRERVRAKLVMIGDGPDRGALEQRVADLGVGDAVKFVGEQLDLVPWLSAADLFLLPSAQESFGMAALEAMACEVVVVASRIGGLPEIIKDGATGFLCDADDTDGMAARAVDVLQDPAARARIGRAASAYTRATYCVDKIVPLYEDYYREVLDSRPSC